MVRRLAFVCCCLTFIAVFASCASHGDNARILMAATEVLCPVALQGPALQGLKTFFRYLQSAQKLNLDLRLEYAER